MAMPTNAPHVRYAQYLRRLLLAPINALLLIAQRPNSQAEFRPLPSLCIQAMWWQIWLTINAATESQSGTESKLEVPGMPPSQLDVGKDLIGFAPDSNVLFCYF